MLSMNECALMSLPWQVSTKSPSRSQSLRSALSCEARSTVAKLILVFSEHCSQLTAHVGLKRKKDPLCRISPRIWWPIIEQADSAFRSPCPITAKSKPAQNHITESVETAGQKKSSTLASLDIKICWNFLGLLCVYFKCGQWTYVEISSFQDKFQACVVLSTFACFLCSWGAAGQIFWNFSLSKPHWLEPLILC